MIFITEETLEKNGFNRNLQVDPNFYKENFYIDNYCEYTYTTEEEDRSNFIVIDVYKGMGNRVDAVWNVHIDNNNFETIGSIDLSTLEEFNSFMFAVGSKFRLKE